MPMPQLYASLVDANGNLISATSPLVAPGGRLTLTSATPVLTAAVTGAANVIYTPYLNNYIPIWNGSVWVPTQFSELTNVLANSSVGNAGPAAGASGKNYDLFVWNSSGTLYLTRGAAWNSDTVRSATTENDLQRVQGVLCNLNAITNGPAVGYGTYVGTVMTDAGAATVTWQPGASGTAGYLGVWNMYNRVGVNARCNDNTASWTYSSATIREANGGVLTQHSFIRGLNEENVECTYGSHITTAAVATALSTLLIGLDATNAQATLSAAAKCAAPSAAAFVGTPIARYDGLPGLGKHFLAGLEQGDGANTSTFVGPLWSILRLQTRM